MININNHTKAIFDILEDNVADAIIKRNTSRNGDPNFAESGWIGIYKKGVEYEAVRISNNPYKALLTIDVEIQYSSMDETLLEENLSSLEQQVLELLTNSDYKKLPLNGVNQVDKLIDFDTTYEMYSGDEETEEVHFQSVIISLTYEVQSA